MAFIKHPGGPVFGDEGTGTVFDGCVWMENGRYRMDFSWRPRRACAVTFSDDGIANWERSKLNPIIEPSAESWDEHATYKPTVVWNAEAGKWMLWYNGRRYGCKYMGYARYPERNLF